MSGNPVTSDKSDLPLPLPLLNLVLRGSSVALSPDKQPSQPTTGVKLAMLPTFASGALFECLIGNPLMLIKTVKAQDPTCKTNFSAAMRTYVLYRNRIFVRGLGEIYASRGSGKVIKLAGQKKFEELARAYGCSPLLATLLSSTAIAACEAPIRTSLTLMQNGKISVGAESNTLALIVRNVYQKQGVLGFFRGMPEAFGLFATYNNLFFSQYLLYRNWCQKRYQDKTPPTYVSFPAGIFMGGAAVFVAYPFDFLMTIKQKPGNTETAREIIKRVGFRGLYSGATAKVAHQALTTGGLILFLSTIVPWIERQLSALSQGKQAHMTGFAGGLFFKHAPSVALPPSPESAEQMKKGQSRATP